MRPVIFGEVVFDRFEDDSTILGGAPFNLAWHLQAFGFDPLFISAVGEDELGDQVRMAMEKWGMDTSGLQINGQYSTGVVKVIIKDNEPSYEIVKDSAWDYISYRKFPELPKEGLLYHGTLALRNIASHSAWQWLRQQNLSTPRFVDVNLRVPWWQKETVDTAISGSHWVKVNADELNVLLDIDGTIDECAKTLLKKHNLRWLVVTQGEKGAIALSDEGQYLQITPETNLSIIDTVGAGDAFSAILVLGVLKSWSVEESLKRAQDFASAIVGIKGATTTDRDFYQRFIGKWDL